MTRHEKTFRDLIASNYEAAVEAYFKVAVANWLDDGPEEVVRTLTAWTTHDGHTPRLVMDHETLVELHRIETDPDAIEPEVDYRWAVYSGPFGAEPADLLSRSETREEAHEDARRGSMSFIQARLRNPTVHPIHRPLPVYGHDEVEGQGGWKVYGPDGEGLAFFEVVEEVP